MAQHPLHFGKLCPLFEHAPRQAMPQQVRRDAFQLARVCMQLLTTCQIPLACGRLTELHGSNLAQISNTLAGYARFNPRYQWTPAVVRCIPTSKASRSCSLPMKGMPFGQRTS